MRNAIVVVGLALLAGCGESASEAVDGIGAQVDLGREAAANTQLALIRRHLSAFQLAHGRFPVDLDELAADQRMQPFPTPPTGLRWDYDPATGQIAAVSSR